MDIKQVITDQINILVSTQELAHTNLDYDIIIDIAATISILLDQYRTID
jgi:hypothetical protein